MAVTSTHLRNLQLGQEVTKGTGVAATVRLITDAALFDLKPTIYEPTQQLGILAERHAGVNAQQLINWTIDADCSFEQILYFLNMGLKKVATGTGAGADKTYQFTPSPSGADDFMTYTAETRHSDGANHIDRKYTYMMAQEITISAGLAGATKVRAAGFAQEEASAAITGSIAVPAAFTIPAAQKWALFSDANFAALGTTAIAGQLYGFEYKLTTGLLPAFYLDGSLDMTRHRRGKRMAELTLTLDQEASSGIGEVFRTRLVTRALSYLQLKVLGDTLGSSNYTIKLDGAYSVDSVSPVGEHDGEDMLTVKLTSKYDVTGAQDIKATVVTAAATLT